MHFCIFLKLVRERRFFYFLFFYFYIGHVINEEGRFYKCGEFTKKYNIHVNYLEYFGCVQAVKTYLKNLKITIKSNRITRSLAKIYTQVKGTKFYYDILL